MNTKELIEKISKRYAGKLQEKTGWGKNEAISQHQEACIEVLS